MSTKIAPAPDYTGPVIIGGVGGGGTRVYKAIAETAGIAMLVAPLPVRVVRAEHHDNFPLMKLFYRQWTTRYLRGELSKVAAARMRAECRFWLWSCGPSSFQRADGRWGWKNPNSMFLLPFFKDLFPDMRFIHVVRDGRDHAFQPSFSYANDHHRLMYRGAEMELPDHVRKGIFWGRSNEHVERDAARCLRPDRYLVSRFEDLCEHPETEAARILAFLGTDDASLIRRASELVRIPSSFNRWRSKPPEEVAEVEQAIADNLAHYGYELMDKRS